MPDQPTSYRKGWKPATLERLGVTRDGDGRFVFQIETDDGVPRGTVRYAEGGVLALKTYIHPKVRAVDFVDDVLAGRADTNADTTHPAHG